MITVKTLSNYNDRSRVVARQTNWLRDRNRKTFKQKTKGHTNRCTSRLKSGHTHRERGKQEMKNEALCSVVTAINKQ